MSRPSRFLSALLAVILLATAHVASAQEPSPPDAAEAVETLSTALDASVEPAAQDGLLLDEALTPVAGYFQAAGGAAAAKPKYPTIIVSGAAQIDSIWFAQDDDNQAVVGDALDVAGFRRARLGAKGNLAENVSYQMEYDFGSSGRPNFTNVFVEVADLPTVGHFRIGQWKQPFSMEPATSFRELMFMERSLAFVLTPFRQIGAGFYNTAFDEQATWAVSGYRFATDAFGNASGDAGYGMTTRETMLLWDNGDGGDTIHLGGGYSWNSPSAHALRFRTPPEVGFTQQDFRNTTDFPVPFFVDTGVLPVDNYQLLGGELAAGFGSLLFQSEFIYAMVNQPAGPTLHFPAGYAQLGYVLSGERRPYDRKTAAYTRVVPDAPFGKGCFGALEAATRFSVIDLNDETVGGGRLQDLTFGLNWYLNKFTRFEFNYIHPILDRPVGNESHADVFGARAQLDF